MLKSGQFADAWNEMHPSAAGSRQNHVRLAEAKAELQATLRRELQEHAASGHPRQAGDRASHELAQWFTLDDAIHRELADALQAVARTQFAVPRQIDVADDAKQVLDRLIPITDEEVAEFVELQSSNESDELKKLEYILDFRKKPLQQRTPEVDQPEKKSEIKESAGDDDEPSEDSREAIDEARARLNNARRDIANRNELRRERLGRWARLEAIEQLRDWAFLSAYTVLDPMPQQSGMFIGVRPTVRLPECQGISQFEYGEGRSAMLSESDCLLLSPSSAKPRENETQYRSVVHRLLDGRRCLVRVKPMASGRATLKGSADPARKCFHTMKPLISG